MPVSASIGSYRVGGGNKPLLIAGPCVIESAELALSLAESISKLPSAAEFQFVFKASYLKDNRSAGDSFRGPGIYEGLRVLENVRARVGVPVLSDVHTAAEVPAAAAVLDVVQIPAFLCRQTSLLEAAGACGKPVNVKKGQFMAPEDMVNVVKKLHAAGADDVLLTERGSTFGYHDLVVDFRGFARMRAAGAPVIFDVTHSLQRPGGLGNKSGGEPALAAMMARAAAAVPVDGFFIETHPDPSRALSDAASMLPFDQLDGLLAQVARIVAASRGLDGN
ncbi:MAG: 3-deoxy-8-phosphooctulonate synthase [Candidatus Krumholzibacteria bacterium]|nr:3-deoxy-8-phosphooctulonate synthase [Candidatus Krumholzibacteria bacterium]MDH4336520.1 3-deoxy-8-phosphooctulonate synthase [Candidatus Krumholzibacteria bacterium]MDH5269601.1 3-deoxy-8-phosphooctulonate synthase [Candidatus Krumholzibacteria bacterium]MDH5626909.1 3-deoxy-8-phosphooctulonate synthase [Candidatus Krumholzibacteria bacterium]